MTQKRPVTATKTFFGDGEYWFHLPLKRITEFEQRFGRRDRDGFLRPKSILMTFTEVSDAINVTGERVVWIGGSDVLPAELNEVIRLGLIGGNEGPDHGEGTEVGPQRAGRLVDHYGYPARPIEEVAAVALRILHAVVHGDPQAMEAEREAKAVSGDSATPAGDG